MDNNAIIISCISGVTPVGGNIEQTCAAIGAGISVFEEYEGYMCQPHDPDWDPPLPLTASAYSLIDPELDAYTRLITMSMQALNEIMQKSRFKRQDLNRCGFFLALPARDDVTSSWPLKQEFVRDLCGITGISNFAMVEVNQSGSVGVFSLIHKAQKKINNGDIDACIIGGVDTFIDVDRLALYDAEWRIKSDRNVDGFTPGEGAIMLLLEKQSTASARGLKPMLALSNVVGNIETNNILGEKRSTGTGLGEALEKLHKDNMPAKGFSWTISDMNGESYAGHEWGTILVRHNKLFHPDHKLDHPADCVGELGSAAGALLIAYAAYVFSKEKNMSDQALFVAAADNGERAVLLSNAVE